jgi:Ca2+-binding EF-hand superfamily protein
MRTCTSLAALLAATTLALAPAAFAQTDQSTDQDDTQLQEQWWTEWDNDKDGLLSDQEFATVYSNSEIFGDADSDKDGMWSQEEVLQTGYMSEEEFTEADADGDGMLTEDQTMDAIFTYWDADESGTLDEDELSAREPMDMMGGDNMESDT